LGTRCSGRTLRTDRSDRTLNVPLQARFARTAAFIGGNQANEPRLIAIVAVPIASCRRPIDANARVDHAIGWDLRRGLPRIRHEEERESTRRYADRGTQTR
jgi:hypothetical protein